MLQYILDLISHGMYTLKSNNDMLCVVILIARILLEFMMTGKTIYFKECFHKMEHPPYPLHLKTHDYLFQKQHEIKC